MKTLICTLSLFSLLAFQVGCDRRIPQEEIEREESVLGTDDIRETESFNRSQPLGTDDEIEVDRDVIGDDEIEIND